MSEVMYMNNTVVMHIFNKETKKKLQSKPQTIGWENIFIKYVTDKRTLLRIYQELFHSTI